MKYFSIIHFKSIFVPWLWGRNLYEFMNHLIIIEKHPTSYLNHSFNWFNKKKLIQFAILDTAIDFMYESMNYSFNQFIQKSWFIH